MLKRHYSEVVAKLPGCKGMSSIPSSCPVSNERKHSALYNRFNTLSRSLEVLSSEWQKYFVYKHEIGYTHQ